MFLTGPHAVLNTQATCEIHIYHQSLPFYPKSLTEQDSPPAWPQEAYRPRPPPHLQKFPKCLSNFLSKILSIFCPKFCPFFCPKLCPFCLSIFCWGGTPGGAPPPVGGGYPRGPPKFFVPNFVQHFCPNLIGGGGGRGTHNRGVLELLYFGRCRDINTVQITRTVLWQLHFNMGFNGRFDQITSSTFSLLVYRPTKIQQLEHTPGISPVGGYPRGRPPSWGGGRYPQGHPPQLGGPPVNRQTENITFPSYSVCGR